MGNKRYAREHKGVWGQKNCSDNHKILQFWNKALGLNYTKNKGKKKKIKKPWLYAENTYFKESFFCGICDLFEGFIFACARNAFYLTLNSPVLKRRTEPFLLFSKLSEGTVTHACYLSSWLGISSMPRFQFYFSEWHHSGCWHHCCS